MHFLILSISITYASKGHPIKLTSSEIKYDAKTKSVRVECKLFIDDFAPAISATLMRSINQSDLTKDDLKRIENYFISKYKILINGKLLSWKIKSYDIGNNILSLVFIINNVEIKKGDDLEIENALLFEAFGDVQSNWMTIRFPPYIGNYNFESKLRKPCVFSYLLNLFIMDNLSTFFINGWEHIVDIKAYDHLLFVMTLCAAFKLSQWRQVLIIITAFTIGHSGTLILSSLDIIPTNPKLIDLLIPFTIMITAVANIINYGKKGKLSDTKIKYIIALVFGLIHGLAFASNFKFMLFSDNIIMPLFLFNLGIEVGQLFIVLLFMAALWLYTKVIHGEHLKWNLFVSGAGFGIAATIFLNAL